MNIRHRPLPLPSSPLRQVPLCSCGWNSICIPGWLWTHRDPLASPSQLLRLRAEAVHLAPSFIVSNVNNMFLWPCSIPSHVYVYIMKYLFWFKSGLSPKGWIWPLGDQLVVTLRLWSLQEMEHRGRNKLLGMSNVISWSSQPIPGKTACKKSPAH